ncbi:Dbl homology domain-containing protein [Mycena sanguinolenta]|nr:Dbl homology domain-containing protein [Mycena sanguinolenta]KAJ6515226.1 Dbl homology domain-containing protein [Mycena sanguinolenta]
MTSHWQDPVSEQEKRNKIINNLIQTEREYAEELELMQTYATSVSDTALLSPHTLYLLFSNLSQLLDFQRQFLSRLEVIYMLPWQEQRWGRHFAEAEDDFIAAYEPWIVNWSQNSDLQDSRFHPGLRNVSNRVLQVRERLTASDRLKNLITDLPVLTVAPIARAYLYPRVMESLLEVTSPDTCPHYAELQNGLAATKRVAARMVAARRRVEYAQTTADLRACMSDWRGHDIDTFGALLLHQLLAVNKSNKTKRVLFKRVILCCADLAPHSDVPQRRQTEPLVLTRHVLVADIKQIQSVPSPTRRVRQSTSLDVWWEGTHGLESMTLCFLYGYTMRLWETQIRELIRECALREAPA